MRARIDVSEIEAKTKIRAKYLRALENEEWGLLPGPTFVKSFLRTYGQALGLDGKALVEEYRLHHERPSEGPLEPIVSTPQGRRNRGGRSPGEGPSRGYAVAVSAIGLVIVVLVVLLVSDGGGGSSSPTTPTGTVAHRHPSAAARARRVRRARPASPVVALSLRPAAVVYVCLIGEGGRELIPGLELQPGENTPVYHAKHFQITLGNSSVTLLIDGIPRIVPPSAEAIGYSITKAYGRQPLAPGHLPTCT